MRIQATSHVKMSMQTKGEVPDQQRHLLLQHSRSAMMPMPCGLCSPQVHRQCTHEPDVHTCCSLSIVHAFILPVWIVQQHPSLPRILLPNLKLNMPNCCIYIIQLSITTLLSSARTLFMWVRFSQQLLQSSSSSTFIPPEFTYSPPSLADQKPLRKFHLREEQMDANPENKTKHQ